MKIHNFIKDTKGMAQNELAALKKQESLNAKKDEQVTGREFGESTEEKSEPKKGKKKAQAEAQGVQ